MEKNLKKALISAYNICLEVQNFTSNVIASDGKKQADKSDLKLNKEATNYINWYNKTFNLKALDELKKSE